MQIALDLSTPALDDHLQFAKVVRSLCETLVMANRAHLRAFPDTPDLYKAGVSYLREKQGVETALGIPAILRQGGSDCLNLTAWRVAELRERENEAAAVRVIWFLEGDSRVFHVLVRRGNGKEECPSALLGM